MGWTTVVPEEAGRFEMCPEGTGSSICRWIGLGGRGRENNQELSTEQRHFPKTGRAGGTVVTSVQRSSVQSLSRVRLFATP